MDYTIYAALADETNEGWVWFKQPVLPTRTVVKIHNPDNGRTIFCQSRQIDENFLKQYNDAPHTLKIDGSSQAKTVEGGAAEPPLVMGAWYRDALGGLPTKKSNPNHKVNLTITRAVAPWRNIRAACQHPDIVARVGTRLGLLGVWLGIVALLPVVFELADVRKCAETMALLVIAALLAVAACLAGRGVNSQ